MAKEEKTGYKGVYRRTAKDGKHKFYISYRFAGKQHHEPAVIPGTTMTAAKAAALRLERMSGKALPNTERRKAERAAKEVDRTKWTIGRLWAEYVESRYKASSKSHDTDRLNYRKHLEGPFAAKEPHEIAALDVERVRRNMEKKLNLQAATVARVLGLLIRIVNFGTDKQLCKEGLSFKIKLPRSRSEKTEHLTDEQTAQYIKVCQDWPDVQAGAFQLFLLFTGVRRSEARKLLWADVDLDRGFMTLRNPKGGVDQKINFNELALELLKKHPRTEDNPFVFSGVMGGARGL
ncbi:MAG: tyrosine-type recombinase/integrase, partial [Syntrophorhabdaceae bacterium]|nr:tyrosine-type recombinase/integrase [Syntrophorhabdaceae bacterium]